MTILRGATRSFFYIFACVVAAELPALSSVFGISQTRLLVYLEANVSSGQTVLPPRLNPAGTNQTASPDVYLPTYFAARTPALKRRFLVT